MRTSTTFSILFWIYSSRAKNNETSIYARITVNGKNANISLKYKVDIRLWDSQRQRATGTGQVSKRINQYIDQVHAQLVQTYQDLRLKGQLITADLIKSIYLGEDVNSKSLQELIG